MNPQLFKALVEFLTPDIIKQSTAMRNRIGFAAHISMNSSSNARVHSNVSLFMGAAILKSCDTKTQADWPKPRRRRQVWPPSLAAIRSTRRFFLRSLALKRVHACQKSNYELKQPQLKA
jgi:hypothetical protein